MFRVLFNRVCFTACTTIFFILISIKLLMIVTWWNSGCYYSSLGDALPSAEELTFFPNIRTIFFHEATCNPAFKPRQACAIEAAARVHPHWQVYVLFSSPVTRYMLKTSCLSYLLQLNNINFARMHMAEYSKGTPAQSILINDLIRSKYPIHHAADVLRMVTLNKWGGIYLDTNMIVTRSMADLPLNFVVKENDDSVTVGALSFAKDAVGTNVTDMIIRLMYDNFSANEKNYAVRIVNLAIKMLCPNLVQSLSYATQSFNTCEGITILGTFFYDNVEDIFQTTSNSDYDKERPYTIQMFDNMFTDVNSSFMLIPKRLCPTIYSAYTDDFN